MRLRILSRWLAAVVVLATVMMGLASCNFGGASGEAGVGCSATSNIAMRVKNPKVRYFNLPSYLANDVDHARTTMFSGTPVSAPMLGSGGTYHVEVRDAPATICGAGWWNPTYGGVIGIARCAGATSTGLCQSSTVYLSVAWHSAHRGNNGGRYNACHELGHAVGLAHTDDASSCLIQGRSGTGAPRGLSDHDKEHLNDFYS